MAYHSAIPRLIHLLKAGINSPDRTSLRNAARQLAELCKQEKMKNENEWLDTIMNEGAVEAIVPLLSLTADVEDPSAYALEDIERDGCFILGLLAVKPELQMRITQLGAIPSFIRLLAQHSTMLRPQPVARRAADAIMALSHENVEVKNLVRELGGIPVLVDLLGALDPKLQRAGAGALRSLAFKNEENKTQIVECGALPLLIQQMLRSEDTGVHYEAVGVIGNLVHSSKKIKLLVLEEGALQPVIGLLSSPCPDSQREAALLLGQFATTDPTETMAKIAQRGAIPPLVELLKSENTGVKEMAAFALGRLAQNSDTQCGGLGPLLDLLESKHHTLQHNSAFALYGVADNEDNISAIIRLGAFQRLLVCAEKLQVQASKVCIQKTIARLEAKLGGRVLIHVVHMMRSSDWLTRRRAVITLARLAPEKEIFNIFVSHRGLDLLMDMLTEGGLEVDFQREVARSVLELTRKISANSTITECTPEQPTKTVYLGEQYVNNPALADVTFLVEGRPFHAHRIALVATSDAFNAMFVGGFREKEINSISIPNIPWDVFKAMMVYVYTGAVDVEPELASALLQASDQYLLDGLKRLCEITLGQNLDLDNVMDTFELAEAFSAPQLGKRCALLALEHYNDMLEDSNPNCFTTASIVMQRMVPHLRVTLLDDTNKMAGGARHSPPA
eukprot:gene23164-30372_t